MRLLSRRSLCPVCLGFFGTLAIAQEPAPLTLDQAHAAALENHPAIRVADLNYLAAQQVTREARSGFFPAISANVVAVGTADENTRLAAVGGLNNPAIFERNAEGLNVIQLITDFGRTANLAGSAKSREQAEEHDALATREQILLQVDAAFFGTLKAQALTSVATQTVTTRQSLLNQVTALASNKLRSELDVSFALVALEEARLLLSKTRNDARGALAQLSTLMGLHEPRDYRLIEGASPPEIATNLSEMVEHGLQFRPDLLRVRKETEAAIKFARAERALRYPTVVAIASAGVVPVRDPQLPESYAAAGVQLSLPVFTGGLYSARQAEAAARAKAAEERLRDAENKVVRDIHIAWLNAQNASERLKISAQLLENASRSFDLAKARYQNGVSSIVELNQAQLNKVSAEIELASTRYDFLLQRSIVSYQTGTIR